jgi:hypothetical protein
MEFINVRAPNRDKDPHYPGWVPGHDIPHRSESGYSFTSYNHFIDVKKGEGIFDDYDGYSYERGSASSGEYQRAEDATDNVWATLLGKITGKKVDEGINWWLNDEYVHAPGRSGYRPSCSPAIERYSFYQDKGVYANMKSEAKARFPLADYIGAAGKGIPYSVFMPVDNLARYWYSEFKATEEPAYLGMVMHAIQDASIPHHAAGYSGNWHGEYEAELNERLYNWYRYGGLKRNSKATFNLWNRDDDNPPSSLVANEYRRAPRRNWSIDMLVTWMALNAYNSYSNTYQNFENGYEFDAADAKNLTMFATALSMLVLNNASEYLNEETSSSFAYTNAEIELKRAGLYRARSANVFLTGPVRDSVAKHVVEMIKYYRINSVASVGRPFPFLRFFLVNGKAPKGAMANEESKSFNPANLTVRRVREVPMTNKLGWAVRDGRTEILRFKTAKRAKIAIKAIQKYGFSHICFVGRPKPAMIYFRK